MMLNPNRNPALLEKKQVIESRAAIVARQGIAKFEWRDNEYGHTRAYWDCVYYGTEIVVRDSGENSYGSCTIEYRGQRVFDSSSGLYLSGDWEPLLEKIYTDVEKTDPFVIPLDIEIRGGMRKM
jgi:hypothetical protein